MTVYHCCDYYSKSLNEKYIAENKCFWKTINPVSLNKLQSSEKIKLDGEANKLITNKVEVAMKLNNSSQII